MRALTMDEVGFVSGGFRGVPSPSVLDVRGGTVGEVKAYRTNSLGWGFEITSTEKEFDGGMSIIITLTETGENEITGQYTNGQIIFKNGAAYDKWRSDENWKEVRDRFIAGTATGMGLYTFGPVAGSVGTVFGGVTFILVGVATGDFEPPRRN